MNLKNKNIFLKPLTMSILLSSAVLADITGTVYKDFNGNGVKDSGDTFVSGISVLAYCEDMVDPITSTTNGSGAYVLTGVPSGKKCRIEADPSSAGMGSASNGIGSSPLVDIVLDGAIHNISVGSPMTYCQANPDVVTVGMPGGVNLNSAVDGTLFKVALPVEGTFNGQDTIDTEREILTTHSQTGAVWGLAWKKSTKDLFLASNLRRYVPLLGDAGVIYKIDTQTSNSVTSFATIPNVVSDDVKTNIIPNRPYGQNKDEAIAQYVGRQGLGDLDISEDEKQLYTVNLNTKELVTIDALTGNILSSVLIPNPYGTAECTDADVRPWALKVRGNKIYIGSVCETKIESNVGATVQEYTGAGFNTIAQTNTLLYLKPRVYAPQSAATESDQYHNWTEGNNGKMPMLTDIEFDNNGNLVLAYTDREAFTSDSTLTGSGDIRKMCLESDGSFTDESTGVAPTSCAVTPTVYPGNTEKYYEFYIGDNFFEDGDAGRTDSATGHPETSTGALAQAPGVDNIIVGMVDGTNWNEPGSIGLYSHTTGDKIGSQAIIKNSDPEKSTYFGKAGGLGDVELLCDSAPIEIGNYVWIDSNSDGIQDANEPALSNVPVKLYKDGTLVGTAITDATGHYYFGGSSNLHLSSGELLLNTAYKLVIDIADANGNPPTQANVNGNSDDVRDNDSVLDGVTAVIEFNTSVVNDHTLDFGFSDKPTVSIGSLIWEDLNNDGLQDDSELGIADVNVTLLDENGTAMTNPVQKTLSNGQYYFSGLDEGDYSILVSPPTGMGYVPCTVQTTADNDDTENDSNIKSSSGNAYTSGQFTLQADTEPTEANGKSGTDSADDSDDDNGNMTVDFCFYRPASLGDYVWYDNNKDGIQDAGESGVKNVTVKLLKDCDSSTVAGTLTTDVDGKYKFTNLDAGDYCVEFSNLPTDFMVTTKGSEGEDDSDASTTVPYRTDETTLDAGENDMTWDMGIYSSKVAIGDFVWYDLNKNGQQDADEAGVPDIDVKLLKDCTTEVNSTKTDENGKYIFESLTAGTYCVEFGALEDGFVISPKDSGDNETDSDVNATTKRTAPVTLAEGTRDLTWDMGIYAPASLGNKVWNDKNANGVQDDGEAPVAGVDVTLLGSDCATAFAGVDPQTTDADGLYLFEDLVAGDYCVRFTNIPAGYAISPQDKGDNAKDSDVNVVTGITTPITLNAGDNDLTWDMGIYEEASIGNYVWNDANANGEQEDTEEPVSGVTVTLYDKTCTVVAKDSQGADIATVQTDAAGLYIFEHLMPSEYCLGFTTLPDGFGATFKDTVADDNIDSDADASTLKTISTVLDAGENDMSWDMGIFQASSIGDTVWYDKNANGVQDAGETGVENVTVNLYQTDCTTVAVDGMGVAISAIQTDVNGNYTFTNLVPNDYCVGFDLNTLPAGYKVSPKKVSSSTTDKDSNADEVTGITESTNLIGGENDREWDMGIYSPASLGDRVWLDENANGVQDANETGVKDVTVTLYDKTCETAITTDNDGNALANSIKTDVNGNYVFTNLIPAEYCVGFSNLPVNHVVSPKDATTEDKDSDVNPATMKTVATSLESGENDPSWDMGIYVPASIGNYVWLDENGNGVQDNNETGVENVAVTLYEGDCATVVTKDDSGADVPVMKTGANGEYNFTNLTPNEYCVGFELPKGYTVTVQDIGDETKDSDVNPATMKTVATSLESGENDPTWDMGIYKPATIGNVVWNDLNGNGEQEDGEMGVENVNVSLYNCDCTTPATDDNGVMIPNVLTDANGVYSFTELRPNDYCVGFTVPTGYVVSPQSATADDSKDSDVNSETNATECTTLSSDENDTTWDMGIYIPASIGDRVWYDINRDGVQDSGELGVANATVTLYQPDGITVVERTQTDEDGNFLFDELVPNDYRLGFDVPSGYALSDSNKTNDNNDSDVNPLTGKTDVTSLESGENDISWDAGIYELSTLGDKVWYDENHNGVQDTDEPAVKDVKVVLYESDCTTVISDTRSDENGQYLFIDLEPKEYCIGFEELPVGYQFTPNYDNTGAGNELDCNVDPGTGKTPVITLPHATDDRTWDMGIIPKCKDEEDRVLRVFDDNITASTTGSVTTVNILANDHGNLDIESIRFVDTTEGAILWENGTAVGGTSLKTTDKLIVVGEGNWTISNDGTVSFKAEDGFTGVPTPVYYIINCKQGSTSNVGQVKITSNCVCDTYKESMSDSVPVFSKVSMILVLVLTSVLGMFFFRRELTEMK